jgi:hypothetical protein
MTKHREFFVVVEGLVDNNNNNNNNNNKKKKPFIITHLEIEMPTKSWSIIMEGMSKRFPKKWLYR